MVNELPQAYCGSLWHWIRYLTTSPVPKTSLYFRLRSPQHNYMHPKPQVTLHKKSVCKCKHFGITVVTRICTKHKDVQLQPTNHTARAQPPTCCTWGPLFSGNATSCPIFTLQTSWGPLFSGKAMSCPSFTSQTSCIKIGLNSCGGSPWMLPSNQDILLLCTRKNALLTSDQCLSELHDQNLLAFQ